MPRLTNVEYIERHHGLRRVWIYDPTLYAVVSFDRQLDVHAFYQPDKDLTDAELLAHRKAVSKEQPSLPARASKAFARMDWAYVLAEHYSFGDITKFRQIIWDMAIKVYGPVRNGKRTELAAIARPEIDVEKLAWAIREYVRQKVEKDKKDLDQEIAA